MPLSDKLVDWGLKAGTSKYGVAALGIGLGYHFTPEKYKPKHPIAGPAMFFAGLGSGAGIFDSALMASSIPSQVTGMSIGQFWPPMRDYMLKPGIGSIAFPNAYMPELQWGLSALSHEDLNARYGGPNPNSDAALFVNNFDNSTGRYIGPTVGQSFGARSSAMNLGASGNMVFGMYNNRLSG